MDAAGKAIHFIALASQLLEIYFIVIYVYAHITVCGCVSALRGQKRVLDSMELALTGYCVSCLP